MSWTGGSPERESAALDSYPRGLGKVRRAASEDDVRVIGEAKTAAAKNGPWAGTSLPEGIVLARLFFFFFDAVRILGSGFDARRLAQAC